MSPPVKTAASVATERIVSLSNQINNHLLKDPLTKTSPKLKMSTDYRFAGWLGLDKHSVQGKMEWKEFEPKTWTEDDVDIKVTHCGICGSDLHTLRSGWGVGVLTVLYEARMGADLILGRIALPLLCRPRIGWHSCESRQERQALQIG